MCRRSRRVLTRLDWLGRLDFVDLTTLAPTELPVPIDAALRGMPMRTREGQTLVGYAAVVRALRATPLGFVPAVVMGLPGIARVGRAVYDRIAASRRRDACALPASRSSSASAATPAPRARP